MTKDDPEILADDTCNISITASLWVESGRNLLKFTWTRLSSLVANSRGVYARHQLTNRDVIEVAVQNGCTNGNVVWWAQLEWQMEQSEISPLAEDWTRRELLLSMFILALTYENVCHIVVDYSWFSASFRLNGICTTLKTVVLLLSEAICDNPQLW